MRSPPNRALALPLRRGWSRRQWSDAAFITMMTIGWAAGNILAVLGCVVAAFLVIAHGDFSVFMSHIDNVASRYVAADTGRRAGFEHEVVLALAICAAVFFLIRLPRFVMRLRLELAQERRHDS
jgi:hypothetical protein